MRITKWTRVQWNRLAPAKTAPRSFQEMSAAQDCNPPTDIFFQIEGTSLQTSFDFYEFNNTLLIYFSKNA